MYRSMDPLMSQIRTSGPLLHLAAPLRQLQYLAAVLQVVTDDAPHVLLRPVPMLPAARSTGAQVPGHPLHDAACLSYLRCRVLGEVLGPQHLAYVVGPGEREQVSRFFNVSINVAVSFHFAIRLGRSDKRLPESALLSYASEVQPGLAVLRCTPKHSEGLIKELQVLLAVHQQRPKRQGEVLSTPEPDVSQDLNDIQHSAGVDVKPKFPEHASKEQ